MDNLPIDYNLSIDYLVNSEWKILYPYCNWTSSNILLLLYDSGSELSEKRIDTMENMFNGEQYLYSVAEQYMKDNPDIPFIVQCDSIESAVKEMNRRLCFLKYDQFIDLSNKFDNFIDLCVKIYHDESLMLEAYFNGYKHLMNKLNI